MKRILAISLGAACVFASSATASSVTGDPVADGWTFRGHSLANGTYVRGPANYGFNTYSTSFQVTAGSSLEISDGANSWLAGDTILGMGGSFAGITPGDAGWGAITGTAINSLVGGAAGQTDKFVAKFGTADATFAASGIAPGSGDGVGSTAAGGLGTVFVRTSVYGSPPDAAGAGQLHVFHDAERTGTSFELAAGRFVYTWSTDLDPNGHVGSWQFLLNVSLMERLDPLFAGLSPTEGDLGILAVQNGDSVYTDALVAMGTGGVIVPLPTGGVMGLAGLGALVAIRRRR